MSVEKWKLAAQVTALSGANLQALANNTNVLGGEIDNTQGAGGPDGYTLCDAELYLDGFGSAPTANTAICAWFLGAPDGSAYEDGGTSVTPARLPDVVFPLRAVTTAQRIVRRVWLPWGKLKVLGRNDGTGQAVNNNTNSFLKIRPVTREAV